MPSSRPFDDFRDLVYLAPGPDLAAAEAVRQREATLTKPPGSLGRLEEIVAFMAAWQGRTPPVAERTEVVVFAANHGVAARGVSAYPAEVTVQMVANFAAGGAAINQICAANGLGLRIHELALDHPTPDISREDAFDERGCAATMAYGMEAVTEGTELLCLGEMGIGNTTVAAAILHALHGGAAEDWTGPGTGVAGTALARKTKVVAQAVARLEGEADPFEILRRLGGREVAALCGAILSARHRRVPVILDGYVVTAAASVLYAVSPRALDHCLAGHLSAEPAHQAALQRIGKVPLLAFGLRLGEATGAALAAGLVRAAVATHAGMATFADAGVSKAAELRMAEPGPQLAAR